MAAVKSRRDMVTVELLEVWQSFLWTLDEIRILTYRAALLAQDTQTRMKSGIMDYALRAQHQTSLGADIRQIIAFDEIRNRNRAFGEAVSEFATEMWSFAVVTDATGREVLANVSLNTRYLVTTTDVDYMWQNAGTWCALHLK